jgi:hypothetical protein
MMPDNVKAENFYQDDGDKVKLNYSSRANSHNIFMGMAAGHFI